MKNSSFEVRNGADTNSGFRRLIRHVLGTFGLGTLRLRSAVLMPDKDSASASEQVLAHPLWYHTLEVVPGVVTPGWFDLRPIVDRIPFPDVQGKRCLDVGPYDGFFAFELERRGASEVVAVDIGDHASWDWPYADRISGPQGLSQLANHAEVGAGFELAKRLMKSRVERVILSVYDLSEERLGQFDLVTCGSLMLHLKDPVRALEAIRSVTGSLFLSSETISLQLSLKSPRHPAAELKAGRDCQWWIPNIAGHRALVESAGFAIQTSTRPYSIRFGPGHQLADAQTYRGREVVLARALAGGPGVPHAALLASPTG